MTEKEIELKRIKEAAEQGDVDAQYMLGDFYANGEGVKQDYEKAIEWIKKAADQGHIMAKLQLKVLQKSQKNSSTKAENAVKAVECHQKAAAQEDAATQFNLGVCYEEGKEVAQDYAKAVEWYRKAAD